MNPLLKPMIEGGSPANRPLRIGVIRFSAAQFLGALVLFLVVAPFVETLPNGSFIDGTLLTLVLGAGVLAVGWHRKNLILAAVLAAPPIVGRWLHHYRPDLVPQEIFLVGGLVFVVFVVVNLFYFILRAPEVDSEVLCAGISAYLLLGLLWAFAYRLAVGWVPNSFAFNTTAHPLGDFEALYFSFVSLSTVGYGDITPLSNAARMLAMTEAMTGTLFVAVFIARLVALYSAQGLPAREAASVEARQPHL